MRIFIISKVAIAAAGIATLFAYFNVYAASTVFAMVFSGVLVYLLYDLYFVERSMLKEIASVLIAAIIFIIGFAVLYRVMGGDCQSRCVSTFGEAIYFSIVTATTLGYGDFTPTVEARFLAALQAVTGYVFLGFILAIAVKD